MNADFQYVYVPQEHQLPHTPNISSHHVYSKPRGV